MFIRAKTRLKQVILIACAFVVLAVGASDFGHAQASDASEPSGEVLQRSKSISGEIYSPFCPGKTLAMCPSPRAADVRRDIQGLVASGLPSEEVKARILQQYGQEFRVVEPPKSDNFMLLSLVLIGLVIAAVVVRRNSAHRDAREVLTPRTEETVDTELADLRQLYRD
jgi:cytochrome c-type biogenesis protein CcmH/NrfF